jgi:hypothetical protein
MFLRVHILQKTRILFAISVKREKVDAWQGNAHRTKSSKREAVNTSEPMNRKHEAESSRRREN